LDNKVVYDRKNRYNKNKDKAMQQCRNIGKYNSRFSKKIVNFAIFSISDRCKYENKN